MASSGGVLMEVETLGTLVVFSNYAVLTAPSAHRARDDIQSYSA